MGDNGRIGPAESAWSEYCLMLRQLTSEWSVDVGFVRGLKRGNSFLLHWSRRSISLDDDDCISPRRSGERPNVVRPHDAITQTR